MVQINIWFVPRSRSTALARCLSNIPDSKVFFETFLWAYYLGDEDSMYTNNPEQLGEMASVPITPGYNTKTVIKQLKEDTSNVKIVKDFFYTMNGRHEEVIEKDSVNIFLVRDPRYVFTSFLPVSQTTFYSVAKLTEDDVSIFYKTILDGIEVVSKMCTKAPVVIDGALLSTKESAAKVVKSICQEAGLEFSDSMLTWESCDGFDPSWVLPEIATTANTIYGSFKRANSSSNFEDSKEREVDLEALAEENAGMYEDFKACKPYYDKIMSKPFLLKID